MLYGNRDTSIRGTHRNTCDRKAQIVVHVLCRQLVSDKVLWLLTIIFATQPASQHSTIRSATHCRCSSLTEESHGTVHSRRKSASVQEPVYHDKAAWRGGRCGTAVRGSEALVCIPRVHSPLRQSISHPLIHTAQQSIITSNTDFQREKFPSFNSIYICTSNINQFSEFTLLYLHWDIFIFIQLSVMCIRPNYILNYISKTLDCIIRLIYGLVLGNNKEKDPQP